MIPSRRVIVEGLFGTVFDRIPIESVREASAAASGWIFGVCASAQLVD
jgi:hypothetical protein